MALQTSGPISIGNLKTEFGDTGSSSLSEFYRGGSLVPNTGTNAGVPTSGLIKLSNFYGAAATAQSWQWVQTYTSMDEGVTRTFQFEDVNDIITSGSFSWSINGTTADFSAVSGTGTISATSQGSFSITTLADAYTEGTENYTLTVSYGGGTILTQAFSVLDTSLTPTVTINVESSEISVNEGGSFTFYATATTAISGTVSFSLGGTATGGGTDYTTTAASGTFTFNNSTTSNTVTVSTVADSTTEGSETVSCTISNPSVSGFNSSIGTSSTSVTINDTSLTPVTINVESSEISVNEGGSFTFYATASAAISGTVSFSLGGTATGGTDYNTSGASGTFTFSGSTTSDSVTVSTAADSTTEGDETVSCTISGPSVSGFNPSIGTSSTSVTINDTSLTPPPYAFSPGSYSVAEGDSVTVYVNTTNVSNGTTLYWTISNGTTSDADFSSMGGSFSISGNSGSFSVSAALNCDTSNETATLQLRTDSSSGTIKDTASLTVTPAQITVTSASNTSYYTGVSAQISGAQLYTVVQTSVSISASSSQITATLDGSKTGSGTFTQDTTNGGDSVTVHTISAAANNLTHFKLVSTGASFTSSGEGYSVEGYGGTIANNTWYSISSTSSGDAYIDIEAEVEAGTSTTETATHSVDFDLYYRDSCNNEVNAGSMTVTVYIYLEN